MKMKRILIPLLATFVFPISVRSEIDPKIIEMCMKAADFQGCVNAMTGKSFQKDAKSCDELKTGLAIVKERLISGTSLKELDINTNPLSDALAKAKVLSSSDSSCISLISDSQNILEMIRILKNQWSIDVNDGEESAKQGGTVWPSPKIELNIKKFNLLAGGLNPAITGPGKITGLSDRSRNSFDYEMREFKGALLAPCNVYYCGNYIVKSPLSRMFDVLGLKIDAVLEGKEIEWREAPKIEVEVVEEKPVEKKSPKNPKINCKSPVWKNKPQCR